MTEHQTTQSTAGQRAIQGLDEGVTGSVERSYAHRLTEGSDLSEEEKQRIQKKQGGHHMPPRPADGPPLDDTDRNTDKIIKPSQQPK
jgi:hypothetical protein